MDSRRMLKWSQNFLKDSNLVRKLVDKSSIEFEDILYEIGPGKGIITEALVEQGAQVIGIEKDKKLYENLCRKFAKNSKIEIKFGDFLKYSLSQGKYKVFSNIPFGFTADIIAKLTSANNPPQDAYLIVQKEAAKKFAGFPYSKKTQMYALLLKPWFELSVSYHFKRTDFYPVPHVDAVLLQIKKRESPLVKREQSQLYRDFVVYGFNQWKPSVKESLNKIFTHNQFNKLVRFPQIG